MKSSIVFCYKSNKLTYLLTYRSASERAEQRERLADKRRPAHRMASAHLLACRRARLPHRVQDRRTVGAARRTAPRRHHQVDHFFNFSLRRR